MDYSGGSYSAFLSGGFGGPGWFPSGLALDLVNSLLYWGDIGVLNLPPNGSVNSMTITGAAQTQLTPHVTGRGRGFALDQASQTIFLTSHDPLSPGSGGAVFAYDIVNNTETLIVGPDPNSGYWDIEIDQIAQRIWWTVPGLGEIRSAKFDGTDVQVELSGLTNPYGLALETGVLSHFQLYEADGRSLKAQVDLRDQFGPAWQVHVGEPELFGNPVAKTHDGEVTDISDPTAHLTAYKIDDKSKKLERRLTVKNQFGDQQTVTVKEAKLLLVPSEKNHEPSNLSIDHFKCYEADGKSLRVTVDLADQFGEDLRVRVGEPEYFCNPVTKRHDGKVTDIGNPEAHLACYEIEGDRDIKRKIHVANQFGEQHLEIEEAELLCVPSEKLAVEIVPDDDDSDDDSDDDDRSDDGSSDD